MFPGYKAYVDGTEQEIRRTKRERKRKTHNSGKKKRHNVKTQLTVNYDGLIVHMTGHVKGSMHDYALFRRSRTHLRGKVREKGDIGYLGVKKDFPRLDFEVPFKKKNPGRGKVGVKRRSFDGAEGV